jgi:hypothetical protein
MDELIVQAACNAGDLEQFKTCILTSRTSFWKLLHVISDTSVRNHPHLMYWLIATFPLLFKPNSYNFILMDYNATNNKTIGWNFLIGGRLLAIYYNRFMSYRIELNTHTGTMPSNIIPEFLMSEYLI